MSWSPTSWQSRPARQQPTYPDAAAVDAVVADMGALPPLVTSWEVEALKAQLASCATGELFLLQGGDCAESFQQCDSAKITAQMKILLQMSLVLLQGTGQRVTRVGRIAGQYAKPRSADMEKRGDTELPSYRGDLVNRSGFSPADRIPDPQLMLRAYERAGITLNFIRALIDGGFADLRHPEYWDLSFVKNERLAGEYRAIVDAVRESIAFLETFSGEPLSALQRVDFFTSHEGLALLYEQAQTRTVPRREGWYNLTTHFPWIGMRTAEPGGAHVEYFRGIRNPIAVKVGPGMTTEWLGDLLDILHPDDEPGRLTLIHRFGAGNVATHLPPLVETVQRSGKTVLWCCDPMHGNTETTDAGIKTRRVDRIRDEVAEAFAVHTDCGSHLGGVHIELTGEDVTECLGGAGELSEPELERNYRSTVDPRLNYGQALELSFQVMREIRSRTDGSAA